MRKDGPRAAAQRIAAGQHGIITRAQALHCGMTARMIQRILAGDLWQLLYPSVYLVSGHPRTWLAGQAGAVLGGGTETVASHRAAGRLLGLDGCNSSVIEISSSRHLKWPGVIVHRRLPLRPRDRTSVQNIPTTTATRTLLDLAAVVNLLRLEAALDSALGKGLTSVRYLQRMLEESSGPGRRGAPSMRNLLDARLQRRPNDSELERVFEKKVTRHFALPRPLHSSSSNPPTGTARELTSRIPTAGWRWSSWDGSSTSGRNAGSTIWTVTTTL